MASAESASRLRFLFFATGVTAIGGFLFGYDTAVINGASTFLKAHLGLSPAQEGLAGASAILGCIPGAMSAGFLSDRFGRKKVLFLCATLYAVSGVLSAIPRTFDQFLVARILSGLGIGASSMICPVYIAEISPEIWRGRLGSLAATSTARRRRSCLPRLACEVLGTGVPSARTDCVGGSVTPAALRFSLRFASATASVWPRATIAFSSERTPSGFRVDWVS